MSEIAARHRTIAGQFTERVRSVPDGAWDQPAPCDGWVARDIVRHMVEWMPGLVFGSAGLALPNVPSVDEDPAAAWAAVSDAFQAALDDPEIAGRELTIGAERFTFEVAVSTFCLGDVLVHTWDLARATGLDESLDADEVHRFLADMEPVDELLRRSGHYGPRVEVADDADEQTKLIAFTGRHPGRGRRPDGTRLDG